jgi:hypothetical protein
MRLAPVHEPPGSLLHSDATDPRRTADRRTGSRPREEGVHRISDESLRGGALRTLTLAGEAQLRELP